MISKEMTILDIVSEYPKTEDVFRSYDEIAGKCVLCNNLFDTLENFSEEYNTNLEELIIKINHILQL